MKKPLLWGVLVTSILVITVYTGLWLWMAGYVRAQFDKYLEEAREKNITITTRSINVRGYPFTHEVRFSGRVAMDGVVAEIPALHVRSLFIPGKPIRIEIPQGLSIVEPADSAIWSLDRLLIESVIPASLPGALTHEDMTAWKQAGGELVLNNFELRKKELQIIGNGTLGLDDTLQPTGLVNARVTGHLAFLMWLQQNGYVDTRQGILATTILRGLSKTDDENNNYMDVALTLQNRTLFVGPLRVTEVPAIVWGWRHQPARLR